MIHTWGSHPSTRSPRPGTLFVVPRDSIRIHTNDPRILALADRLWERAPAGVGAGLRVPAPLTLAIDVVAPEHHAPATPHLEERWKVGTDDAELSFDSDQLHGYIACTRGQFEGRVSATLVTDQPSMVARLMLETPVAALLARRGYCVLHAGAVTGPGGSVVIRGSAGAGKSTLVAAAHRSGMGVLGDESVLADRSDPDDLLAAVRDITVLPDSHGILGLDDALTAPAGGAEDKRRIDLFASSTPATRRARRVATVLLGSRHGGPARLDALTPEAALREFHRGQIAQERWSGTPEHIAQHWSRSDAYLLSGTADLVGAVAVLADLVSRPAAARRA